MPLNKILSAVLFTGVFSVLAGVAVTAQAQDAESQVVPSAEEAKEEAQANTKYLAAQALKKAKAVLNTHGEFAPFGAGLFQDGEVNFVWAVKPGESTDGINPVMVLNAVRTALTTQAKTGRILGSAVVYQYRGSGSDGEARTQVNVELEYLNGYAEVIATQYEQGPDGIEYTSSGNQPFEPKIFKGTQSGGNDQ
jgi:hypothetical protein